MFDATHRLSLVVEHRLYSAQASVIVAHGQGFTGVWYPLGTEIKPMSPTLAGEFLTSGLLGGLVLVTQSCPTLYESMDYSPPDSSVHGILQGRILE